MSASTPESRQRARDAALQRLAATRARLRQGLIPSYASDAPATGQPFTIPRRLRALWRSLRRGLRGSPVAAVAMTALQDWWQGHPWRATGELVAEELHASLTPVVRRHPIATVLVSGAIGLAVMTAKPWRWPYVKRQLQPMPGRLTRWLFHQLGQAPGQALLSGLLFMLARHAPAPSPSPSPSPSPPSPAPSAASEDGAAGKT